jgi:hypothetical protein
MAGSGGGAGYIGQLRSVTVRKKGAYKKKHCQERPGQLYDDRERLGEADERVGRRRQEQEQGQHERRL